MARVGPQRHTQKKYYSHQSLTRLIQTTRSYLLGFLVLLYFALLYFILFFKILMCRSQWPRGLRRRTTVARVLGLWVRIKKKNAAGGMDFVL